MCTVVGALGLVATIGSAVMGTMGAVRQANAQNAQMEYNAKVSENNARNAQAEADYARAQGWRNANEKRREVAQLIGAQRAKMGASGAVVDSGSFLDLTLSTKEQGELDAMALAQEVASKRVTINTVSPGYIGTDMVRAIREDVLEKIVATIPVKRLGQPEEIAAIVSWLASEQAGFTTGANFACNGGNYMS